MSKVKYDGWDMKEGRGKWNEKHLWVIKSPREKYIPETIAIHSSWAIFNLIKFPFHFLWARKFNKGFRCVKVRIVEEDE